MPRIQRTKLTCPRLAEYFREAFHPREDWLIGIEIETMGRNRATGRPLPYEAGGVDIRRVVETYAAARGGALVFEGERPVGIDGPWGGITLEPGGQLEWSSRPAKDLTELDTELDAHLAALSAVGDAVGVQWLDVAVDPDTPVGEMPWMPKARYGIMRETMGRKGRLAHRMMTQTASIQCAFDYASDQDWTRKFRAAALLTPIAVALFANSSRIDGQDSGWASYRQAIWRETDPDRCGLPDIVFDRGFGIDRWVDWVTDVPTLFLRRGSGLVDSGGAPLRVMLDRCGCDAVTLDDWELHLSSIFTEVRSYSYLEVRSADRLPDALTLAVPAFWTGILYDEGALEEVLAWSSLWGTPAAWRRAMDTAARSGLAGLVEGTSVAQHASRALAIASAALSRGGTGAGNGAGREALARLAHAKGLSAEAR